MNCSPPMPIVISPVPADHANCNVRTVSQPDQRGGGGGRYRGLLIPLSGVAQHDAGRFMQSPLGSQPTAKQRQMEAEQNANPIDPRGTRYRLLCPFTFIMQQVL